MEERRCRIGLQDGERLAGYALARQPGCAWIASLRDTRAVSVSARTVAAKEQLVVVPLEKIGGKGGIAGKCVARETLTVLKANTTPKLFHTLVWENGHRVYKLNQ